jgi:riboflavin kinase/FMN adenylyltransferase
VRIFHRLERDVNRPLALAIGFFDGFHRGHREIARQTRRMRKPGWRSGVLTFADHPAAFLRPGQEPALIDTQAERIDRFAEVGFEECFLVTFDDRIATLSPQAFLDLLVDGLGARAIVVGSTFRFGHRRTGDARTMRDYLSVRGAEFAAVENTMHDGERISSTRIRRLISEGNLHDADQLLAGNGYEIRGIVEVGAGRGHRLGFPTANVRPPAKLLPKDGVYSATARCDGRDYPALVSIGTNPQFGGGSRTIEAWLRDFHQTIYGRELALRGFDYVREQKLFGDVAELIEQMQRDLDAVAFPKYG